MTDTTFNITVLVRKCIPHSYGHKVLAHKFALSSFNESLCMNSRDQQLQVEQPKTMFLGKLKEHFGQKWAGIILKIGFDNSIFEKPCSKIYEVLRAM